VVSQTLSIRHYKDSLFASVYLHHGGGAPQTPVGDSPRVLIVAVARRLDVVRRRFNDHQVYRRRWTLRRAVTAATAVSDRRRITGLVRPHHGDEQRTP